ncbi:MAG: biotin transporter BioY [Bacteroidetes bacterium]|mgnify:CR=1 FL=1|jgi:biotin transport system substrate-specific component|nr:biotin transporter BioY [Bacteroidota bacterium]
MSNDAVGPFVTKLVISLIALILIGPLSIDIPTIPLTLQTFVLVVTAYWFRWSAVFAAVIYILAGLAGLPIFSGFEANPAILLSPSAGFVIGFPVMSLSVVILQNNSTGFFKALMLFLVAHVTLIMFAVIYNYFAGFSFIGFTYIFLRLMPSLLIKSILASLVVNYVGVPKRLRA